MMTGVATKGELACLPCLLVELVRGTLGERGVAWDACFSSSLPRWLCHSFVGSISATSSCLYISSSSRVRSIGTPSKMGGGDNGRWIRGTSSHCAGGMRSARGTWSMIHCLPKCFLGVQCVGPGVLDASPSESELDG